MKKVKSKASLQIVQAILIMLAMVCGMLLLPGNNARSSSDCATDSKPESGSLVHSLQSMFSGSCVDRDNQE